MVVESLSQHVIMYLDPALNSTLLPHNHSSQTLVRGAQAHPENHASFYECPLLILIEVCAILTGAVGIFGNLLIILVYARRKECKVTELLILSLGAIDLIYCICNEIMQPLFMASGQFGESFTNILKATGNLLFNFFPTISWLTVMNISVNRWFAVCRPFSYKQVYTMSMAKRLSGAIFLVSFFLTAPSSVIPFYEKDHELREALLKFYNVWRVVLIASVCVGMIIIYSQVIWRLRKQAKKKTENALGIKPSVKSSSRCVTDIPCITNKTSIVSEQKSLLNDNADQRHHNEEVAMEIEPIKDRKQNIQIPSSKLLHPHSAYNIPGHEATGSKDQITVAQLPPMGEAAEGKSRKEITLEDERRPSLLVRAMNQAKTKAHLHGTDSHKGKKDNATRRTTITLCSICLIFVALNAPNAAIRIRIFIFQQNVNIHVTNVSLYLYLLSFVINPFIYYLTNTSFRTDVKELLSKGCCPKPSSSQGLPRKNGLNCAKALKGNNSTAVTNS